MLQLIGGILIGAAASWAVRERPRSWPWIWRPAGQAFRNAVLALIMGIAIATTWNLVAVGIGVAALILDVACMAAARLRRAS